jgi:hypothetical protein
MLKISTSTSKADIVQYAEDELGTKLNSDDTKVALTEQVRELEKAAGIVVDESSANTAPTKKEPSSEPIKAVIIIHQPQTINEDAEPDTHWSCGLNGRNFQVQFGEEVTVPWGVYDILRNAVETKYHTKKNQQTGADEILSTKKPRFAHSLVRKIFE